MLRLFRHGKANISFSTFQKLSNLFLLFYFRIFFLPFSYVLIPIFFLFISHPLLFDLIFIYFYTHFSRFYHQLFPPFLTSFLYAFIPVFLSFPQLFSPFSIPFSYTFILVFLAFPSFFSFFDTVFICFYQPLSYKN